MAAEKRIENRKAYNAMLQEKKIKLQNGELEDEDAFMREGKARILNFEFTSLRTFGISSNFLTPNNIVSMV